MPSQGVVEDSWHVNAQTSMYANQLWPFFFPGCETFLQIFQRNGIEWSCSGLRRFASPVIPPAIRATRLRRPGSI